MRSLPLLCVIPVLVGSGNGGATSLNDHRIGARTLLGGPGRGPRTIAIDERLAREAHLGIGDRVVLTGQSGAGDGDTAIVAAITAPRADPSEIAHPAYRIRMHLDALQSLSAYGDRVDRFAIRTGGGATATRARDAINGAAFGFRAYRSADVAVGSSRTFQVVRRFHRAIAVITVVASAVFLLCLLLLKVEERRRDVAALRLMGISRRTVVWTIVVEAAIVALVGSGVGLLVGCAGARVVDWHYQVVYHTPLTFALVTPGIVALAVSLSCILGIGAGGLAAIRLVAAPPLTLLGR